jgi:putative membrane protein
MLRKFLKREDLRIIREAVVTTEQKTSGEIVPVIAWRSARTFWLSGFTGFAGLVAGSVAAIWLAHYHPFAYELRYVFLLQALGLVAGFLIGRIGFVVRAVFQGQWLEAEVHDAAKLAFLRYGLFNTKDRTGVLIFLAVSERKVVILADKGINDKVGGDYWRTEVEKISAGVRAGTTAESMAGVIQEIGKKLAEHFPCGPGDKNELHDRVRLQ